MRGDRRGFTLVEMLVVIGILVLLTTLVVVAVANTRGTDRMRSTARTAQSAFLGARDRAIYAKEQRGIRLTRDPNDFTLVTGFEYIRPLPIQTFGDSSSPLEMRRRDVVAPTGNLSFRNGICGNRAV
ncbi:MAG: prepilin-type N-terminal cleavage/methylation domain-containing protein [Planctomycetota bacterium]|nr:prepilin-type N-terminal cleavage/methylation domain-containing protein [Planctomycetota bacterium]